MQAGLTYGKVLCSIGHYSKALRILNVCSGAVPQGLREFGQYSKLMLSISAHCHLAISSLSSRYGAVSHGEAIPETAILQSIRTGGADSSTAIALQHALWLWFLEQGRHHNAECLRDDINPVLHKLDVKGHYALTG